MANVFLKLRRLPGNSSFSPAYFVPYNDDYAYASSRAGRNVGRKLDGVVQVAIRIMKQTSTFESFNAKIKVFRVSLRGITDMNFFLFRLANMYA
jgi:hypothetical protein